LHNVLHAMAIEGQATGPAQPAAQFFTKDEDGAVGRGCTKARLSRNDALGWWSAVSPRPLRRAGVHHARRDTRIHLSELTGAWVKRGPPQESGWSVSCTASPNTTDRDLTVRCRARACSWPASSTRCLTATSKLAPYKSLHGSSWSVSCTSKPGCVGRARSPSAPSASKCPRGGFGEPALPGKRGGRQCMIASKSERCTRVVVGRVPTAASSSGSPPRASGHARPPFGVHRRGALQDT